MTILHSIRLRRRLTVISLFVGMTAALVGLAPAATAAPAPFSTNSCSGDCGPCPVGVTWRSLFGGFLIGTHYVVHSATPTFFASDARQVTNELSTPVTATVTSQVSRTHTVTTTIGTSASLLGFLQANVSVAIVNSRSTAIGVNVQATVPPFSTVLAEYGMYGYNIVYDGTTYLTTTSDLNRNVCGRSEAKYNQTTVGPTIVEGWRIRSI